MPIYQYKALSPTGRKINGEIDAANENELEFRVEKMGLSLISTRVCKKEKSLSSKKFIHRRDLINFTFQLEQLIQAGVPIIDALRDTRDAEVNYKFKNIISTIVDDIEGGKTFAESLEVQEPLFGKIYINMSRVGEQSGNLDTILYELANTLKWQDELIAKSKSITVYPAVVFGVVFSVAIFLFVYLVPQLVPFLKENNFNIPLHTEILIIFSELIKKYGLYILCSLTGIILLASFLYNKNKNFNYFVDNLKIKIWIFGAINLKIKLSRFAKNFALMYGAGMTVLDSISLSIPVMNNAVLEENLGRAYLLIQEGLSISDSFNNAGTFPPLVIRMLKIGESSGNLDKALINISYFYERDSKESIERIEPVIMPVLTVALGGVLLWIMAAVLFPLYESLGGFI